jgi:hypothetical protein
MNQEIELSPGEIKRAIGPLRLIFWGGMICVLDFKFNGFDVINDVVGTIMIAWGVFKLSEFRIDERYRSAMLFVKIISILCIAQAIHAHFNYRIPRVIAFLLHVLGIAKMLATVLFCVAMRWLSTAAGLTRSRESWKVSAILFAVIYLVPFGLLHFVWIVCLITGKKFHFDLGPAALLLLIVFIVPIVHLFISTSRMKTEAESTAINEASQNGP